MHDEWALTGDSRRAVIRGQAGTGRVITAAALIMILVFGPFMFGSQQYFKQIGLGFAAAIFVDAYIIRTVLVPALMHLLGRANWWLPAWLDQALPRLHVEPARLPSADVSPQPARHVSSAVMRHHAPDGRAIYDTSPKTRGQTREEA
jgi:putative drug exporter of the RND superfamily